MPVPPHDDAVAGQSAAPLQVHFGDLAGGHADPEAVVTLAEVPPFDIPHRENFWDLTKERFWELTLFAGKVAGALTLVAVIISPFYALLARRNFIDTFLYYAAIGAAAGTALGCLCWVALRVLDDVEILRDEKKRASRSRSTSASRKRTTADVREESTAKVAHRARQEYSSDKLAMLRGPQTSERHMRHRAEATTA
jgi:uncharacterized membrane protein YcjF (UPF0283 family)